MQITLRRQYAIKDATIGVMTIDSQFSCFTLEDVVRDAKIATVTAIPAGDYPVQLTESPRFSNRYEKLGFGRLVPLVMGVEGYKGIRIHVGNAAGDTEGCILVGDSWDKKSPRIGASRAAYGRLIKLLGAETSAIRIAIKNDLADREVDDVHPDKPLFDLLFPPSPFAMA